jgi:hypothetical protein
MAATVDSYSLYCKGVHGIAKEKAIRCHIRAVSSSLVSCRRGCSANCCRGGLINTYPHVDASRFAPVLRLLLGLDINSPPVVAADEDGEGAEDVIDAEAEALLVVL